MSKRKGARSKRWAQSGLGLVLAGLGLVLAGCVGNPGVSLEASVQNAQVSVEELALVTRVQGGFELVLSLGDQAPESTRVELETFALLDADTDGELLAIDATPRDSTFPLEIGAGQSRGVEFSFDHEANADLAASICARSVKIAGSVTDSLGNSRSLSFSSGALSPDC